MKPFARVLGIDDGFFKPCTKGKTILVGVVYRFGHIVEGIVSSEIKVDALDSTAKIISLAKNKKFDAVICLGAVIRGDTPHFDFIASEAAKGVASVSMQTGIPVIFGVITADTMEQAIERAGIKGGNKGRDAALNAIEMVNLLDII